MVWLRNAGGQKLLSEALGRRPDVLKPVARFRSRRSTTQRRSCSTSCRRGARRALEGGVAAGGHGSRGRRAPSAAILGGLFDLSPAEARVARGLIEGRTVNKVADGYGLNESTVRNQLRLIFAKTGASRQSELVLLCGGVGASGA